MKSGAYSGRKTAICRWSRRIQEHKYNTSIISTHGLLKHKICPEHPSKRVCVSVERLTDGGPLMVPSCLMHVPLAHLLAALKHQLSTNNYLGKRNVSVSSQTNKQKKKVKPGSMCFNILFCKVPESCTGLLSTAT
jgi:hypothetical protein